MSCVTGVIKNEGPLAFYKVGPLSLARVHIAVNPLAQDKKADIWSLHA